jgi:hypothetical protein
MFELFKNDEELKSGNCEKFNMISPSPISHDYTTNPVWMYPSRFFTTPPVLPVCFGGNGSLLIIFSSSICCLFSLDTLTPLSAFFAYCSSGLSLKSDISSLKPKSFSSLPYLPSSSISCSALVDNSSVLLGFEDGLIQLYPLMQKDILSMFLPSAFSSNFVQDFTIKPLNLYNHHKTPISSISIPFSRKYTFLASSANFITLYDFRNTSPSEFFHIHPTLTLIQIKEKWRFFNENTAGYPETKEPGVKLDNEFFESRFSPPISIISLVEDVKATLYYTPGLFFF